MWIKLLQNNVVSISELEKYFPDFAGNSSEYEQIIEKYPMSVTPYYLSLIDFDDENDPIRKMCIPELEESALSGETDTSGEEENTILPGLEHKYVHTALILSTSICATYCRYCFRKRMVGLENEETIQHLKNAFSYIEAHEEINNVLISGGDSFLNTNQRIAEYLEALCQIDHLDFIRFGTKVPVVFPQRISSDEELQNILAFYCSKKQIYVATQFNHANEITEESIQAVECLRKAGIIIKNQTVLLKGVNDNAEVLSALMRRLNQIGIVPYYVFQCRPVRGITSQFQLPLRTGYDIVERAKQYLSGQAKCFKYVLSNREGKIEILGPNMNGDMLFRYHESKEPRLQGEIFSREIDSDTCWVDLA